jgi:hypothetical protein
MVLDFLVNTYLSFSSPCFPNEFFQKKKREKRKQKASVRIRKPECYKSRRAARAVMRMQVTADTTLAALLIRFE